MPRITPFGSSGDAARNHRCRQCLDGRERRRRPALAGRHGDRGGLEPRIRAREQHRYPGERGAQLLLLNSDTLVPPGAIDRLLAELDRHPDVAVVGPRLVDGNGPRRAVVWPDDRSAERVAAEAPPAGGRGPRCRPVSGSIRTGSAARACSCGAPTPKRSAASTSGASCIRRTWISAPRFAPAAGASCSRPISRSCICAAVRLHGPSRHARRVSAQPTAFYEKHHPGWVPLLRLYLRLRGQPLR